MAYDNTGNKFLRRVLEFGGDLGGALFVLDTVDADTAVRAIGYITDGKYYNFRKGDIVIVRRWTTTLPTLDSELANPDASVNVLMSVYIHFVKGVALITGIPDLTDGLAITATNT